MAQDLIVNLWLQSLTVSSISCVYQVLFESWKFLPSVPYGDFGSAQLDALATVLLWLWFKRSQNSILEESSHEEHSDGVAKRGLQLGFRNEALHRRNWCLQLTNNSVWGLHSVLRLLIGKRSLQNWREKINK